MRLANKIFANLLLVITRNRITSCHCEEPQSVEGQPGDAKPLLIHRDQLSVEIDTA